MTFTFRVMHKIDIGLGLAEICKKKQQYQDSIRPRPRS